MTCGEHQEEACLSSAPNTTQLIPVPAVKKQRLTRLVSEGALSTISDSSDKCSPRYVSGCEGGCEEDEGKADSLKRSRSPMRCVSEFDEVASTSKDGQPSSSNPLCNVRLRAAHVRALRLEADLQPMRMILGRLMAHPMNKKGLFNAPVNAIALGLLDYHQIIKRPMDLGTIKSRLYSIAYPSRQEVAVDICLVFQNAMLYNPPKNPVHEAARTLQEYFEELYVAVGGDKDALPASVVKLPDPGSRRVSFTQTRSEYASLPPSRGKSVNGLFQHNVLLADPSAQQPVQAPIAEQAVSIDSSSTSATVAAVPPTMPSEPTVSSPLSGTRGRCSFNSMSPPMEIKNERKKRRLSFSGHSSKRSQGHSCRSCLGRTCLLCEQSCLPLEPTLLVCNGVNCAGAKIRKGATYYIANDGSRQYCQRCFASLPPVLTPAGSKDTTVRYKRDLLKRKNDEELVEHWLTCRKCEMGVHQICALHDNLVHSTEDYVCPGCNVSTSADEDMEQNEAGIDNACSRTDMYTFITGAANPLPMSEFSDGSSGLDHDLLSAQALAETDMSAFIEKKVRQRIKSTARVPNAEKTVTVRIVSDCERSFKVPEVVRKHFRMATKGDSIVAPPEKVNFNSKAIALFQKVDGLDVCIFCMYVQEYDGDDDYGEDGNDHIRAETKKRVYIAYLDSVEHFRPRSARTALYHELLVSYLASARFRGFESAHIWACPPSRGNSFVFWNHPSSQRTPTKDRLIAWYHDALVRAIDCGVVTDVKSLYDSDFRQYLKESDKGNDEDSNVYLDPSGKMVCPPLLEGDYWIEEAVRIHSESLARHLKAKSANEGRDLAEPPKLDNEEESCPARQIATLLLDRIMAHASAAPFRKPVNAAAMKLKDYHKIITKPMDLGTIYSRCVHGEYSCLGDLVQDVQLVFANAKKFNPQGNFVHTMAVEMEDIFFKELEQITKNWKNFAKDTGESNTGWEEFSKMSLSLDMQLENASKGVVDATGSLRGDVPMAASPSISTIPVDSSAPSEKGKPKPPSLEELLVGGPEILSQRMAGEDQWMLDKKPQLPTKKPSVSKKGSGKRRRNSSAVASLADEEPSSKRRRQTWLGEEVGASVRSMRTSFFSCSLVPSSSMSEKEQDKALAYREYTKGYCEPKEQSSNSKVIASEIADARSALLEFSQRRHLEFDTLRHAKYSTSVLLYYLHHQDAPGIVPVCTSCKQQTTECRWHKVAKIEELRKTPYKRRPSKAAGTTEALNDKSKYEPEELCPSCHAKHPQKDQFIPLPVSFKSD